MKQRVSYRKFAARFSLTGALLAGGVAVGQPTPSSAGDMQQQLRECSRIEDSVKRVACFDALAADNAPAPPVNTILSGTGQWKMTTDVSKIDDSTNVFLSLDSTEPIVGRFGEKGPMEFYIACRENKTDLFFRFAGEFMSSLEGGGKITYRIDKRQAQTKEFDESNNHEGLGLWGGGNAIPFLRSLVGGERLFIRATPYNESPVNGEFVIAGLENALKPLSQACGWPIADASGGPNSAPLQAQPPSTQAEAVAGYVIQVDSKESQTQALLAFADMAQKYPTLLAPYRPMVQKADLGAKGIWYRLRIGPVSDKETALRLCTQLKSQGHPNCLVMAVQ
ncbi:type VI secretion system-associated protein TagO [Methyloceanibacter sp.]|uniref:type VI secretion system-associated protein TagO n=1 Tax=Methyloceanibacter sp. TaxID=1965321 RepID=UPI003D6D8456